MRLAFQQAKVYVRVVLMLVVVGGGVVVLFFNRGHRVSVWFFWLTNDDAPVNVVWLMLCTSAATLVAWWVLKLGWGLWRDLRRVELLKAEEAIKSEHRSRLAALDEREQRIDDKLKRAIASEPDEETNKTAEPPGD